MTDNRLLLLFLFKNRIKINHILSNLLYLGYFKEKAWYLFVRRRFSSTLNLVVSQANIIG